MGISTAREYSLGLNVTPAELGQYRAEILQESSKLTVSNFTYPSVWDWRQQHDGVTSVKDQGGCNSCVAFATIGTRIRLDAIEYLRTRTNLDLSEQAVFTNGGGNCNRGAQFQNILDVAVNPGSPLEQYWPYGGTKIDTPTCIDWHPGSRSILWLMPSPT